MTGFPPRGPSRRAALGALAVATTAPLLCMGASASTNQLAAIRANRLLRVAVPSEFPPFGYLRAGIPEGYDISIARMLALDMGVRLEMLPVASPERIPALLDGRVDLVIASLGKTPEREKQIDFSMAYAPLYLGLFARQGVKLPPGLAASRVGVTRGSLEQAQLLRAFPGCSPVEHENSSAILDAYAAGQLDLIAVASPVIESIKDVELRDHTRLHTVLRDSPCHIGLRKGELELQERVNKFLREAAASQALTINAMLWFKATLPAGFFNR